MKRIGNWGRGNWWKLGLEIGVVTEFLEMEIGVVTEFLGKLGS